MQLQVRPQKGLSHRRFHLRGAPGVGLRPEVVPLGDAIANPTYAYFCPLLCGPALAHSAEHSDERLVFRFVSCISLCHSS